jgi:hypothetical protein
MEHHPDKGGNVGAMAELNEAYRLLSKGISFGFVPNMSDTCAEFKPAKKKRRSIKPIVTWFAAKMLAKLQMNMRKRFSYRNETADLLFEKMCTEMEELCEELKVKDKEKIISECADVANYCMMIADNARRKL